MNRSQTARPFEKGQPPPPAGLPDQIVPPSRGSIGGEETCRFHCRRDMAASRDRGGDDDGRTHAYLDLQCSFLPDAMVRLRPFVAKQSRRSMVLPGPLERSASLGETVLPAQCRSWDQRRRDRLQRNTVRRPLDCRLRLLRHFSGNRRTSVDFACTRLEGSLPSPARFCPLFHE